jgi:hypothetical protein
LSVICCCDLCNHEVRLVFSLCVLTISFLENLETTIGPLQGGFPAGELWVGCGLLCCNLLADWLQSDDNSLEGESDIVISWGGACTARWRSQQVFLAAGGDLILSIRICQIDLSFTPTLNSCVGCNQHVRLH